MESVEDEWERVPDSQEDLDVLFIKYRPGQVAVSDLIAKAEENGFQAEIKDES